MDRRQRPQHQIGVWKKDEAQVLIFFALASFVLVGALALALDVGYLMSERRQAQSAADAAALAGARALVGGDSISSAEAAARQYAASNGLSAEEAANMQVDAQGNHWDGDVTVDLSRDVQRFFLGAVYTGPWEVSARAVAEVTDKSDAQYVLVALQPPGIYVNGDMSVTVKNGSIISNDIISSSGESNIVTTDGFIDAVGTVDGASSWEAPWGIRDQRAPLNDPFSSYTAPAKPTGSPPITGNFRCKKNDYEDPTIYDEDCEFWPGYYRNANIRIWDPTLWNPGLYYFENTSIEMISNSGARMDGVGVNFYFTGNPNQSYFSPKIGEAHLTAPGWSADPSSLVVNGDYRDMVIWYDMCPGPELESSGNQEFFLGGVVYAPCSEVYMHGTPGGDTIAGMVIAGSITIKGTSDMGVSYLPYAITSSYEVYLIE